MSTSPHLESKIKDQTLFITLNRPDKLNCFGIPELDEIKRVLQKAETGHEIRTIVFQGAGGKSFSTGADLKQFKNLDKPGTIDWIRKGNDVFNYIEQFPKPVIAIIQGYALGGGLELALSCDFRISTNNALLGFPELQHGWLPGWGGIHRARKLIGVSKSKELIFFAEPVTADEAFRIGLINKVTTLNNIKSEVNDMIGKLNKLDPHLFAMAKASLNNTTESGPASDRDTWFDILGTLYSKDSQS
jgi:3-hydroxypropionyl-coenzyme A dehydratase